MKKLTKMFAVIVVVFAPLCFTACQEEVIEPTYNTTGDSHDVDDDRDGVG